MTATAITDGDIQAFVRECRDIGRRMRRDPSHLIGAFEQSHATTRQSHVDDGSVADYALSFLEYIDWYGCDVSYSRYGQVICVDPLNEDGLPCGGDKEGIAVSVIPDAREQAALTHAGETAFDILGWFQESHRHTICSIGDGVLIDRVVALWLIYQADQMRPGLLDQIGQITVNG